MIVVDTSAILAVVLSESECDRCAAAIAETSDVLISAATLTETLIVAGTRGVLDEVQTLVEATGLEVVSVSKSLAEGAAAAYRQWGKRNHRANLNFGDCFGYALAKERGLQLLYVGNDFSHTDIKAA